MASRILLVAPRADLKGAGLCLLELARSLNPSRYTVMAAVPGEGPLADAFRRASIEVIRVPMQFLSYSFPLLARALLQIPTTTLRLMGIIRSRHIDLVHVATMVNVHPALASRLTRTPLVWYLHEIPRYSFARQCVLQIIRRSSSYVLANSHATLGALWPYPCPPSKVVYVGIDPCRFEAPTIPPAQTRKALGIPDDVRPVIGSVGTLTPLKGQELLLKAAAVVRKRGIDSAYVLVGSGPDEARLRTMCGDLGIADRVWFTGERGDVENLYHLFDILVSTSRSEGFGLTLAEAMAARRPVIATRAGGTEEVVDDGKTGILLPQDDHIALASAIMRLLRNPELRAMMGEAGRARVMERFSLTGYVKEVEAVFEQAMANHG